MTEGRRRFSGRRVSAWLVFGALLAGPGTAPALATALVVETSPPTSGAQVFLDGEFRATTGPRGKAIIENLRPGVFVVDVRHTRMQGSGKATVRAGLDARLVVFLTPVKTESATSTSRARKVDGAPTGQSGRTASGSADTNSANSQGMALSPSEEDGVVEFLISPLPALLFIDDAATPVEITGARSYRCALSPGRHAFRVEKPGHRVVSGVIDVPSGSLMQLPVQLSPMPQTRTAGGLWGRSVAVVAATLSLSAVVAFLAVLVGVLALRQSGAPPAATVTSFGSYRIERFLARGGMANIYLARPVEGGEPVVLKLLAEDYLNDGDMKQKFIREGEILQKINRIDPQAPVVEIVASGIVPFGTCPDYPFIAMEYLDRGTLLAHLQARRRLDLHEAAFFCAGIARALLPAHSLGIYHRDLDPQNVLLCSREKGGYPFRLIDFGIARYEYTAHGTLDGSIAGKPAYMSPEQCMGQPVDGRSDIYSLGVVLYTLLAGKPPFSSANPLEVMQMHAERSICFEGIDSAPARSVLERMLAKNPEDRYPSIAIVLDELTSLMRA